MYKKHVNHIRRTKSTVGIIREKKKKISKRGNGPIRPGHASAFASVFASPFLGLDFLGFSLDSLVPDFFAAVRRLVPADVAGAVDLTTRPDFVWLITFGCSTIAGA